MKNRLYLHLMANKEKGFALPLALLIGLILMVTGMSMIMRAQGDQSKVIAQNAGADSLTSSETGVARVQDLLNSVRVMATVDSNCTSGDCWQTATVPSDDDDSITGLQKHLKKLVDAAPSCSNPNDATILKANIEKLRVLSGGQWFNLGNNRYYRVVGYDYDNVSSQGVLTLEGRSRTSAATDLTKTDLNIDSDDNAASRNRVVVTIPIVDSPPLAFTRPTVPALWISEGEIEADDGAKFEGDVVEEVESPKCEAEQDKIKQPDAPPDPLYKAQFVGVTFPDLPEPPDDVTERGDLRSSETFPGEDETAPPSGVYKYIVDDIELDDGETITITPGKRVVFYVKGNINGAIEHNCAGETGCKSGNLQIYANNKLGSTAPQICLRGDQTLQAFIFAPDYSLGKTGSGTFIGAAWGKNWGNISGCTPTSGDVAVIQGVKWDELSKDLKPKFLQLDNIANWCEEPIDTPAGASECVPD